MKKCTRLTMLVLSLLMGIGLFSKTYAQQNVRIVKFKDLKPLLSSQSDTVFIVNFWATWCAPCVKELPDFEQIRKKYKDKNVRMILVSLDFPKQLEKRVIPFVERKKLGAEVWLLDEPDYNSWIDKIEKTWEGNIPITLIYNSSKNYRKFINGETNAEYLDKIILPLVK